jgi:serine/threonine-protein kinase
VNKYLWILPFISFLGGYWLMSVVYKTKTLQAPALVGKTIQEALRISADNSLSIRLVKEQEDSELPAGTIISQSPLPNTHIKSHQAIQCVISKKTEHLAPRLIGKKIEDMQSELDSLGISYKLYPIASSAPEGTCIAQDPAPDVPMPSKVLQIYVAKNTLQQFLFPDLRQKSIEEVKNFLSSAPVTIQVTHAFEQTENHNCSDCIVSDQRPRPGSIVSLDKEKPIQVQLIATPVVNSNIENLE